MKLKKSAVCFDYSVVWCNKELSMNCRRYLSCFIITVIIGIYTLKRDLKFTDKNKLFLVMKIWVITISTKKYNSLESCAVKSGDILISLVGTIGKVLILSSHCQPGIINPRLVKLSLYSEIYRPYIQIMLASPLIQEELKDKSHGGTMNILNLGLLRNLSFSLSPTTEHHHIVDKVNELFAICDALKARINESQVTQLNLADALVDGAVG